MFEEMTNYMMDLFGEEFCVGGGGGVEKIISPPKVETPVKKSSPKVKKENLASLGKKSPPEPQPKPQRQLPLQSRGKGGNLNPSRLFNPLTFRPKQMSLSDFVREPNPKKNLSRVSGGAPVPKPVSEPEPEPVKVEDETMTITHGAVKDAIDNLGDVVSGVLGPFDEVTMEFFRRILMDTFIKKKLRDEKVPTQEFGKFIGIFRKTEKALNVFLQDLVCGRNFANSYFALSKLMKWLCDFAIEFNHITILKKLETLSVPFREMTTTHPDLIQDFATAAAVLGMSPPLKVPLNILFLNDWPEVWTDSMTVCSELWDVFCKIREFQLSVAVKKVFESGSTVQHCTHVFAFLLLVFLCGNSRTGNSLIALEAFLSQKQLRGLIEKLTSESSLDNILDFMLELVQSQFTLVDNTRLRLVYSISFYLLFLQDTPHGFDFEKFNSLAGQVRALKFRKVAAQLEMLELDFGEDDSDSDSEDEFEEYCRGIGSKAKVGPGPESESEDEFEEYCRKKKEQSCSCGGGGFSEEEEDGFVDGFKEINGERFAKILIGLNFEIRPASELEDPEIAKKFIHQLVNGSFVRTDMNWVEEDVCSRTNNGDY